MVLYYYFRNIKCIFIKKIKLVWKDFVMFWENNKYIFIYFQKNWEKIIMYIFLKIILYFDYNKFINIFIVWRKVVYRSYFCGFRELFVCLFLLVERNRLLQF